MNALKLFPRQSGAAPCFSPLRKPSLRTALQLALAGITPATAIITVVAPSGLDQVSAQDIERQDEAPEEGVTGQADACPSGSSLPRCQPAPPPVISSIAATRHRITANYRTSTWARSHVHYYKFEIHRATSRNGSYTLADTNRFESFSPVEFPYMARGYWYKIRGARCSSRQRSDCGAWSAWSSSVERPALVTSSPGPPAPSGVALSKYGSGADDLRARYTPSQWSGSAVHRYRFEIHRKVGNKWNFQKGVNDSISPAIFRGLPTRHEYKARGKRCRDTARTDCGTWGAWSAIFPLPTPTATPTATVTAAPSASCPTPRNFRWSDFSATDNSIIYRWNAPSGGTRTVTGYQTEWRETTKGVISEWDKRSAVLSASARSVTVGGFSLSWVGGRTYQNRVYARCGSVLSNPSGFTTYTYPSIPLGNAYVTGSSDLPTSGTTVTLTPVYANAPAGTSYLWQQGSNGRWTNLGAASSGNTKTVRFTTRGTRSFRVLTSQASGPLATSPTFHVIWDEWEIVADLLIALDAAVAADASYIAAETALKNCINGPTGSDDGGGGASGSSATTPAFRSFGDILDDYTGATKAKMDSGGACHTQAEAMFRVLHTVSKASLAALKSANAEYAALLETDHGRHFEATVGADYIIKQNAALLAESEPAGGAADNGGGDGGVSGPAETPGQAAGASGSDGDVSGSADTPDPLPTGTGVNCRAPGVNGANLPLASKIRVLNCLVFDTPHSFWIDQSAKSISSNDLKASRRYDWLGYGNWQCDRVPEAPEAACLKHDVVYGSLQKFVGTASEDELDTAWNPRNKHLTDSVFLVDILNDGCQNPSPNLGDDFWCFGFTVAESGTFGTVKKAEVMHWFVNKFNSKTWPTTEHDIEHTKNHIFAECQMPAIASSPRTTKTGSRVVQVTWTYATGCVSGVTVDYYRFCWQINGRSGLLPSATTMNDCVKVKGGTTRSYTYRVPLAFWSWDSITLQTTEIRPADIAYGGPWGFETLLGNRYLDLLLNGAYYDKQIWNITTEAE